MSNYLYLDIETIPTQRDDVRDKIASGVTPPGNITKAESIAAWEADKKPGAVLEAVAKTSFDGAFGHVCCIGWAINDGTPVSTSVLNEGLETDCLQVFADTISDRFEDDFRTRVPIIVGHNVTGFDLRFLWQRAIVLGVRLPRWWPKDPKPWGNEVFDTMTAFAGARGSISLDNLCLALGIKGKGSVDGSMVAGMWERGEHGAIAQYCRSDVDLVRQVHKRMQEAGL